MLKKRKIRSWCFYEKYEIAGHAQQKKQIAPSFVLKEKILLFLHCGTFLFVARIFFRKPEKNVKF